MDHSTCQELYFHEWQRKEEISAASALPVALLSAFLGADVFLIRGFEYEGGWSTNSFLVLIAVSVVVQLIAAWWIIRSYYGYWYERIPATRVLLKYKSDLIKYYEQTGGTAEEAEKEFESYYVERLAEATDSNRDNNLKAGDALHNATR